MIIFIYSTYFFTYFTSFFPAQSSWIVYNFGFFVSLLFQQHRPNANCLHWSSSANLLIMFPFFSVNLKHILSKGYWARYDFVKICINLLRLSIRLPDQESLPSFFIFPAALHSSAPAEGPISHLSQPNSFSECSHFQSLWTKGCGSKYAGGHNKELKILLSSINKGRWDTTRNRMEIKRCLLPLQLLLQAPQLGSSFVYLKVCERTVSCPS